GEPMPATGAKLGTKTRFLREDPVGSGTFVAVAEVKSIGGPSLSRDAVEATHMESPDDHAEFIPGLANGGEVSLVLNFRPEHVSQGATAGLLKDFQDGIRVAPVGSEASLLADAALAEVAGGDVKAAD